MVTQWSSDTAEDKKEAAIFKKWRVDINSLLIAAENRFIALFCYFSTKLVRPACCKHNLKQMA